MAVGMVLLLVMGLVIMVVCCKFDKVQQEGGKVVLVLGLCFILEGVILFAVCDLMCVLLCCIVGGVLIGVILMVIGVKLMVLYGGLFVLLIFGVIMLVLGYLVVIIVGMLVVGLVYVFLKCLEVDVVVKAV